MERISSHRTLYLDENVCSQLKSRYLIHRIPKLPKLTRAFEVIPSLRFRSSATIFQPHVKQSYSILRPNPKKPYIID